MVLLGFCVITAVFFALGGGLAGLLMRLAGRPVPLRRIARVTGFAWLLSVPLFVLFIAPLLLPYFLAGASTRPQDRDLAETPAQYGRDFEEVEFHSRDGLSLAGWYLEGPGNKPAIVYSHGLFRSRREMLERASVLNRLGYPGLLVDLRSHGGSQRDAVSLGYRERLDVAGARDFVLREKGQKEVVLLGASMGAVAALNAAPELDPAPRAVIADSPFLDLEETVSRHARLLLGLPAFPFGRLFVWNFARINGFAPEELNVRRALRQMGEVPILLIYGTEDERMPESTRRAVWEAIPHGHKKLLLFEAAGHGAAFRSDQKRYVQEVDAWLMGLTGTDP